MFFLALLYGTTINWWWRASPRNSFKHIINGWYAKYYRSHK